MPLRQATAPYFKVACNEAAGKQVGAGFGILLAASHPATHNEHPAAPVWCCVLRQAIQGLAYSQPGLGRLHK